MWRTFNENALLQFDRNLLAQFLFFIFFLYFYL
jgi:hypothetical protein